MRMCGLSGRAENFSVRRPYHLRIIGDTRRFTPLSEPHGKNRAMIIAEWYNREMVKQ